MCVTHWAYGCQTLGTCLSDIGHMHMLADIRTQNVELKLPYTHLHLIKYNVWVIVFTWCIYGFWESPTDITSAAKAEAIPGTGSHHWHRKPPLAHESTTNTNETRCKWWSQSDEQDKCFEKCYHTLWAKLPLWGLGTSNCTSPRDWALFGDCLIFVIKPVFYLLW